MKNLLIALFLIASNYITIGQEKEIQNYEFIIVPERFSFLKQNDQHQTSSLTKFLLKKNGFTVLLDSEVYPTALKNDLCNALTAVLVDKSSLFKTKLIIEFKNCYNKVLYTTEVGSSKEKEYKKSYQEAIRRAHASMRGIRFKSLENEPHIIAKKEEVNLAPRVIKKVAKASTVSTNSASLVETRVENMPSVKQENTLYAQPRENGYQLINAAPAVVYILLNTSVKDIFILKNKNGLFYKKEGSWVAEFYENNTLTTKVHQVKF